MKYVEVFNPFKPTLISVLTTILITKFTNQKKRCKNFFFILFSIAWQWMQRIRRQCRDHTATDSHTNE